MSNIVYEAFNLSLFEEYPEGISPLDSTSADSVVLVPPGSDAESCHPPSALMPEDNASVSSSGPGRFVSTLWSTLSAHEKRELEASNLSVSELEHMHGVRQGQRAAVNTSRAPYR